MKIMNNSKGYTKAFSFVKGVKDKIFGTTFHESLDKNIGKQLEEAKSDITNLQESNMNLKSRCLVMLKSVNDVASVEREFKKIDYERQIITEKIAEREERIRNLYKNKDSRFRELEGAKKNLTKALDEKRTIQGDTILLKEQENELEKLKEQLARAKAQENEAISGLEEIEIRFRFASGNVEGLVLDSTVAQKTLTNLENVIKEKKDVIVMKEGLKASIDQVLVELDTFKRTKDSTGSSFRNFQDDSRKLKEIREALKVAEDERSAIPKKIAELGVQGGQNKEKADLLEKERSLVQKIKQLKENDARISQEKGKNKKVIEGVEQSALKLKRLMIAAGLNDLLSKVDSESLDMLRTDVVKKGNEFNEAINVHRKELTQAQASQSKNEVAIRRMREELDKLVKNAEHDKIELESQRANLKADKDQNMNLQNEIEAKIKEKSATMSEAVSVKVELKRIECIEEEAVSAIKRIEVDISSMESSEKGLMASLREEKERLEECGTLEEFFRDKLVVIKKIEKLELLDSELDLAREVASKYERDLRKLKNVEKQNVLFEKKIVLVEEDDVPVLVMQSRISEMDEEKMSLEKELDPLRSEFNFAVEKRDNIEMELSFARESLHTAKERKISLERKLEFISRESGSVKSIQEKLIGCESKLAAAESNMEEVQIRLNFTSSTEEVIQESLQKSKDALVTIDKEIAVLKGRIEEKEAGLPDLQTKRAECERKFYNEKNSKGQFETDQSTSLTDLKKVTIEYDALMERDKALDKTLEEQKEKERVIDASMPEYNAKLQEQEELDGEIKGLKDEISTTREKGEDIKKQVEEIQTAKQALMEGSLEMAVKEEVVTDTRDREKINALREERKAVRGKLKEEDTKIKKLNAQVAESSDADKEKLRGEIDSLRGERNLLYKQIDKISAQLDSEKEGGKKEDTAEAKDDGKDDAKELAQTIGEMDIKALMFTKSLRSMESDIEEKKQKLVELVKIRNAFELEIEKQKSIIAPLEEIKAKVIAIEKESNAVKKSFSEKSLEKERLSKIIDNADASMKTILGNIENARNDLSQTKSKIENIEKSVLEIKRGYDELIRKKGVTLSEFNRFKNEMDSLMQSINEDREMVEQEKAVSQDARKEVQAMKTQLADAMAILTGKVGSIDNLKLELVSSEAEVKDVADRIYALDMDFKSASAAMEGIETVIDPKFERLKYVVWAQGVIEEKFENQQIRMEFEKTRNALMEIKENESLFAEYDKLAKKKTELQGRVGELKSYFELEAQLLSVRQELHEAMARIGDFNEKIESQKDLKSNLEDKYKTSQEEKIHLKGTLTEITRQFEQSKTRWGSIEDLSRIEDSLEMKIQKLEDKNGDMEQAQRKIEHLETEKIKLTQGVNDLQAKCQVLEEQKKILNASWAKTKTDLESTVLFARKSSDEVRKFSYSE